VQFVGVGLRSFDDSAFQEIVGSAVSEHPHGPTVQKFKSLWTFLKGNLIARHTKAHLADVLDGLERQLTSDGIEQQTASGTVAQHAMTKEVSRFFFICLPPRTIKTLLIAPRIPYFKASGVVSILVGNLSKKYEDTIAHLKGLFPEYRTNTANIAFRVTTATIEETVCHPFKLPTELLVAIFTMAAHDCGASPWILQQVCSRWRSLVINTPSLWAHLSMWDDPYSSVRLRYFLAQSSPSKVHVGLLWCDACQNTLGGRDANSCDCPDPTPLFEDCDRIQCLSMELGWMSRLSSLGFPSVQTLTLFNGAEPWYQPISSMPLDISRFPALKRLDIYAAGDGFVRDQVVWAGSAAYRLLLSSRQFPPIQILRLTADKKGHWTDVITACSQTLVSLTVVVFVDAVVAKHPFIPLPVLKSLALHYFQEDAGNDDFMVHLATPELTYCCLESSLHPVPRRITFDGAKIIQMRASPAVPPLQWPCVLCLQMACKYTLLSRLDELGLYDTVFPALVRVEVLVRDSSDFPVCLAISQRVRDFGLRVGRNIQFLSQSAWPTKLYGYDGEDTVRLSPHIIFHSN
jgi:hypothetical protein